MLIGAQAAACAPGRGPVLRLRLGTGTEGGAYFSFGHAFSAAVADSVHSPVVIPVTTSASVDNLRRLDNKGSLALALTTADVAEDAIRGRHPFIHPVHLTALARIYVNYTHLVVRADDSVTAVRDLAGQRVVLGAEGSGAQVISQRLLELAGLTGSRAVVPEQLSLMGSVEALRGRSVRAFFWSGGVPTPAVRDLSREVPLRLLALDTYVEPMRKKYGPAYTTVAIPAKPYGLDAPVPTIGTGSYLVARPDVPHDAVYELLRVLFARRVDIMRPVSAGARLEPRFAISTGSVPLHPGAVSYYRSVHG
ncbi:TAXI family TRAP transporter solute-binding subunit [Streptomyces sp. NPDC101225]|uniref:TAXI family TRAP transporter solute-binding subunit n=1 Tax=Streptomyces sp. NPDC101225 TaxID=3366135 RepID=UPI003813E0F5